MNALVVLLVLGGAFAVLTWLARLHPLISLAIGLPLFAVPLIQYLTFDAKYFRSDGSIAGLFIFLIYAAFGLFCGVFGLKLTMNGVVGLYGRGRPAKISTRLAVALLGVAGMLIAGVVLYNTHGRPWLAAREAARAQQERTLLRSVEVTDRYPLAWRGRGIAAPLRLSVPAADLRRPPFTRTAWVEETADGPLRLDLAIALPASASRIELKLQRDDAPLQQAGPAAEFWVRGRGGAWTFLDDYSPHPLALHLPWAFGLTRVALHTEQKGARCIMSFAYEERLASVEVDAPCADALGYRALAAGVNLLGRLAADAHAPPSGVTRLERARQALEHCAEAKPPEARELLCEYAVQLSGAELNSSPAEARELLVRGMLRRAGVEPSLAGGGWLEDAFRAAGGGHGDGRDAVLAHTMRLAAIGGSTDAGRGKIFDASLEAIAPIAPKLAADDPLFELLIRVVGSATVGSEWRTARHLDLLRVWDEKAQASQPGSDLALKARFRSCLARLNAQAERNTLKGCAEALLSAWESRLASGKSFEPFYGEADLAALIGPSCASYAYATQDFAAVLPVLRRAVELAETRLGQSYAVVARLREFEADIAAKARSVRPRNER